MNWEIFSTIGYVGVGLLLLVPALWLLHAVIRPKRWLVHVAVLVAFFALVFAKVNSATYISRIQVDMSEQIQSQLDMQAMARQAAEDERADEVANIRFAEDASEDFLDIAGLDDTDRAYFESFGNDQATPAWKQQKRQRSEGGDDLDDLEALIGATEERVGVEVAEELQGEPEADPIFMSDRDKTTADRLDKANLTASRWILVFSIFFLIFDYVKRLNAREEVYFPLPIPSAWADAMAEREAFVTLRRDSSSSLLDELKHITRRGETFVLMTDDGGLASTALSPMPRLPIGFPVIRAVDVDSDSSLDDAFVFESAWFGRDSFVVKGPERAEAMLQRFMKLHEDRRDSRAHTRRTVHVVWDISAPITELTRQRFAALCRATGFTLLIVDKPLPVEADV